eukprot:6847369-Ditylum_brightwellii.AAC.1
MKQRYPFGDRWYQPKAPLKSTGTNKLLQQGQWFPQVTDGINLGTTPTETTILSNRVTPTGSMVHSNSQQEPTKPANSMLST